MQNKGMVEEEKTNMREHSNNAGNVTANFEEKIWKKMV